MTTATNRAIWTENFYISAWTLLCAIADAISFSPPATGARTMFITGYANPAPICTAPRRTFRTTGNQLKKSPCRKSKKSLLPVLTAIMIWICLSSACTGAAMMISSAKSAAVPTYSTKHILPSGLWWVLLWWLAVISALPPKRQKRFY